MRLTRQVKGKDGLMGKGRSIAVGGGVKVKVKVIA